MNATARLLIFLTIFVAGSVCVFAQPTLPATPTQAPVDGGLSLLALAGGAYAYNKLRKKNLKT